MLIHISNILNSKEFENSIKPKTIVQAIEDLYLTYIHIKRAFFKNQTNLLKNLYKKIITIENFFEERPIKELQADYHLLIHSQKKNPCSKHFNIYKSLLEEYLFGKKRLGGDAYF